MMHVELALYWKSRNGGTPSTPLAQTYGIFPTPRSVELSQREDKEESVKQVFKDSAVNVTVQGQKHLNAVISSREYLEEYISEKVTNWVGEVTKLAEFALSLPQACYAAYTFGMIHHWTYFLRSLPDIQDLSELLH